jgi:uncharacterized protein (TIRG00374 family)
MSFGILYWLWNSGVLDFDQIRRVLTPGNFVILFSILFLGLFFNFLRFYFVLKSQGLGVGLNLAWRVFWMGLFFNFVVPGGTGGDLIKGYYLIRGREDKTGKLIGAIIYDRFIGMYIMSTMAIVAMLVRPNEIYAQTDLKVLFTAIAALWLGLSLFSVLMMIERARSKLGRDPFLQKYLYWEKLKKIYLLVINLFQVRVFLISSLLTLACQSLIVYFLFLSGAAVDTMNVSLLVYFIVAPIGFMIMAIPIAPGGIGVGQAAFGALFKIYTGVSSSIMVTAVTVYQALTLLQSLLGLYYYLRGTVSDRIARQRSSS